jgi:hexosaminidase
MGENRPYWLNNVTVRYDLEIEKWQNRGELFQQGAWEWRNDRELPLPAGLGLPSEQHGGLAH